VGPVTFYKCSHLRILIFGPYIDLSLSIYLSKIDIYIRHTFTHPCMPTPPITGLSQIAKVGGKTVVLPANTPTGAAKAMGAKLPSVVTSSMIGQLKSSSSVNNAPSVKLGPSSTPGTKTLVTSAGQTQVPTTNIAARVVSSPVPIPLQTPTNAMIQNISRSPSVTPSGAAVALTNAGGNPFVTVTKSVEKWMQNNPWATAAISAGLGSLATVGLGKLKQRINPDGSVTITKRRSTNYANPKALRHSLSRVSGFNRLVKSVNKTMRHAVPR